MIEHPDDREARLAEMRHRPHARWGRSLFVAVALAFTGMLTLVALGSLIERPHMEYRP